MAETTPPNSPTQSRGMAQDEGPRKRHQANLPDFSQADTLVTFLIGPENVDVKPKTFIVHKEIACYHSPVLNAAFNSDFIEGQTQTYTLDDISEGAFKLLVQWLYSQKLVLPRPPMANELCILYTDLVMLWVLADKLDIPSLQNLVLEKIEQISDESVSIPYESFDYIYRNTSKGSQLRRFLVEMVSMQCHENIFDDEDEHHIPRRMLLDLIICSTQRRGGAQSFDSSAFFVPVVGEVDDSIQE
ncbi:hypothetical protein LOCC1_G007719 [Lachnellula occidentalis]|uniref:BTB domain-containing protein n=1 Tax=Lachnellula occidentalis TaxID=215460 RepID=A0A8H8RDH9_9HELO|nr:hypothetical protein LOCC1_G007719 [Lachnellula occidentalis]